MPGEAVLMLFLLRSTFSNKMFENVDRSVHFQFYKTFSGGGNDMACPAFPVMSYVSFLSASSHKPSPPVGTNSQTPKFSSNNTKIYVTRYNFNFNGIESNDVSTF